MYPKKTVALSPQANYTDWATELYVSRFKNMFIVKNGVNRMYVD
jgi:hypothetical protein